MIPYGGGGVERYVPAMISMPEFFDTTASVVNFALVGFFFMAVGMLIIGPMSDKFGRKPLIMISLVAFVVFACLCAMASNIYLLIASRVVQGFAGGGMVALGTALVKDCFEGKTRERALVVVMAIGVLAPMLAPVLGALILSFASWRGTFIGMAVVAVFAVPFALRLVEPLAPEDRISEGVVHSLGRLIVVGKNKAFILLLLIVALHGAPFMTYISAVSYVYIDFFNLSAVQYSLFFAANAALSAVGAFLVEPIQKVWSKRQALLVCIALTVISGVLIIVVGRMSPWVFLATFGLNTLGGGVVRPIATVVLLDQQEKDTGSASALINFIITVLGSGGMLLAMAPWTDYVVGIGIAVFACCGIALLGLVALLRSNIEIKGL
ncbi:MAG: multidrug effflux MFS transporter [Eggerthellaceae bacterium]|nr:multidrug effflux MFS transporter [Eggerthellaceae bacterium]